MIDITGQKFGRLTAIKETTPLQAKKQKLRMWICECDCGNTLAVRQISLENRRCMKKPLPQPPSEDL